MKTKYILSLLLLTAGIATTFSSQSRRYYGYRGGYGWRRPWRSYGYSWGYPGWGYSPYYYGWGSPGFGFSIVI